MTEKEKRQKGMLYQADSPKVLKDSYYCGDECFEISQIPPSCRGEHMKHPRNLFGGAGKRVFVVAPFFCDYGCNIEVGESFLVNTSCVILDETKVTFGDNVFIAPNYAFYTADRLLDVEQRNKKIEYALPIHVGNNVWIDSNVVVTPGVTIGNDTTIGAGSVVTRGIPSGVVAAGSPCRMIRKLRE